MMSNRLQKAVVAKFGGTSISNLGYPGIVQRLSDEFPNRKVICILSAEKDVTNSLVDRFTTQIKTSADLLDQKAVSTEVSHYAPGV
jgi:aspartokinase